MANNKLKKSPFYSTTKKLKISQEEVDAAKAEYFRSGGKINVLPPQQVDENYNPAGVTDSFKKSGQLGTGFHIARI